MRQNHSSSNLHKEIEEIKEGLKNANLQFDVREELAKSILNVPVYVFEVKVSLKNFSFSKIDPFYIKYGGWADPLGQLASAIMNFVDQVVNGVKRAIENVITGVKNALSNAISGVRSVVDNIWNKIQGVANVVGEILNKVRSGFQSVLGKIRNVVNAIRNGVSSIISQITSVTSSISGAIASGIRSVIDSVRMISSNIINSIRNVGQAIQSAISGLSQAVSNLISNIQNAIANVVSTIQSMISNLVQSISTLIGQIQASIGGIIQGIQSAIGNLVQGIQNLVSHIQKTISNLIQNIQNTISNLVQGIQNTIQNFGNAIGNLIQNIRQVFENVGKTIIGSITSFVEQIRNFFTNISKFLDPIRRLPQRIHKFFTEDIPRLFTERIIQWINENVITPFRNRIIDPIVKKVDDLVEKVKDIPNKMVEISKAFEGFTNPLVGISQFFSAIKYKVETFLDNLPKAISDIVDFIKDIPENIKNLPQLVKEKIVDPIIEKLKDIGRWIWDHLPEPVKEALIGIYTTLKSIAEWIERNLLDPIRDALKTISEITSDLKDNIRDFFTNLPKNVSDLSKSVSNFVSNIGNNLKDISKNISDFTTKVISFFDNLPENTKKYIIDPFIEKFKEVGKWIWEYIPQQVKDFAGSINEFLTSAKEHIIDFFKNLPKNISDFVKNVTNFLANLPSFIHENVIKPVTKSLEDFAKWIWDNIPQSIKDLFDSIKNLPSTISNLPEIVKEKIFSPAKEFLEERILKPASQYLSPLVNLLKNPVKAITDLSESLAKKAESIVSITWSFINKAGSYVINAVGGFIGAIIDIVRSIASWIVSNLAHFFGGLFDSVKSLLGGDVPDKSLYEKEYKNYLEGKGLGIDAYTRYIVESLSYYAKIGGEGVRQYVDNLIERTKKGETKGEFIEAFQLIGLISTLMFGAQVGARLLSVGLHALSGLVDHTFNIKFNLPIGGKYEVRFNLASTISHLASEIKTYGDEIGKAVTYGFAIWISEPIRYLSNYLFRNYFVMEIPSLESLRDLTRRHMGLIENLEKWNEAGKILEKYSFSKVAEGNYTPYYKFTNVPIGELRKLGQAEAFALIRDKMRWFLALRGFNDEVILWLTAFETEMPKVLIKDRFGNDRALPTSLLYELPTPSEICRMMIRDVLTVPDDERTTLNNFIRFLAMKGYNPDTAKLYYLLHYSYPSMDKLYEFSCRLVARQTWIAVKPKKELGDIGAEGESPVGLQNTYGLNVDLLKNADPKITADITSKLNQIVENVLRHYAKWHDYAPFAWIEGWTADNLIYLDMMADIPQRIDARWMYKWMVPIPKELQELTGQDYFDERALFLIVVSRGMHPKWVEPITIAECMNALAEERTLARTGAINLYKEGFMTYDGFKNTLSHLCDIQIFGKSIPVRFLPSETELLGVRAKFDRALDILRDFMKDVLRSAYEFVISYDQAIEKLKNLVEQVGNKLGLNNVSLDEDYFELYKPVVDTEIELRQIERIRYWYRYMLYRILYRFSEGYMSKEEFDKTINSIVENAKLTEKEKQVFEEVAKLMYDGFRKKTLADGILNKLKRGVISPEEAKQELMKLGLPEDLADALIEKYSKIYTLTISTLLSYAEYVDIPESFIKKKLELMGMPEDEIDIVLQVFKVRPLRDERAKVIRATLESFIKGLISEDELRKKLKELGKSEREVDLLVEYAKIEKGIDTKKLQIDAILNKLKRGAISDEEAKELLKKYIVDEEIIDALIEKYSKIYTLSIATLLSYAEYVDIPEDFIKRKLEQMGVPEDEVPIVLEVFKVRPLRDERAKAIRSIIEAFIKGHITEEELRNKLKEFGKSDREIDVLVEFAKSEKDIDVRKLHVGSILNKLKRGAISEEEARKELKKYITDEEIIDALIERNSKTYTLSIATLLSYAEYVDVPEEFVKRKLELMGVPEDEVPIVLQVFKVRPLRDERAKVIRSVIDGFIKGYVSEEELRKKLKELGKSERETDLLVEFAKTEKEEDVKKLYVDAILNKLRRGAISVDEAKKELNKFIVDKALVDAIIEKYIRTYTWTPDKMVSMAEYIPIDVNKLIQKAKDFGYPEDEVKLYKAYLIARNLNEEINRVVNEYVNLYVNGLIDEKELEKRIDEIRTLNGEVKKLGVNWIVIDDMEKKLILLRAKLRRMLRMARKRRR